MEVKVVLEVLVQRWSALLGYGPRALPRTPGVHVRLVLAALPPGGRINDPDLWGDP